MKVTHRIIWVSVFVAALAIAVFAISKNHEAVNSQKEKAAEINKMNDQLSSLEYELNSLRAELNSACSTGGGIFFLFSGYNEMLSNTVAPFLYNNGLNGIICASPEEAASPEIQALINDYAWEVAAPLGEALRNGVINAPDYLALYSDTPDIAYFESGSYDSSYDKAISEYELSCIVIGGMNSPVDYYAEGNGIIKIISLPFTKSALIESSLEEYIINNVALAVTIHFVTDDDELTPSDDISLTKFKLMVQAVLSYSDSIQIGNCGDFSKDAIKHLDESKAVYDELSEKIARNEALAENIRNQISLLTDNDNE